MLAAAKRRGEIQALDSERIAWKEDGSSVSIHPVPGFIPKILATAEGGARFHPLVIPALTNSIGHSRGEPDRLLCPVRALRHYLKRTERFRRGRRRLFISFQPGRKDELHRNTLSAWIKEVVRYAYWSLSDEQSKRKNISAHEVRALGASLALQANYSLEDILRACAWANHTTFSDYYLRDLTHITGRLRTLGPLVAAGSVTQI